MNKQIIDLRLDEDRTGLVDRTIIIVQAVLTDKEDAKKHDEIIKELNDIANVTTTYEYIDTDTVRCKLTVPTRYQRRVMSALKEIDYCF